MTEDEMIGWHHRLDGHGFGETAGDDEGQGGLAAAVHGSQRVRLCLVTEQQYPTVSRMSSFISSQLTVNVKHIN